MEREAAWTIRSNTQEAVRVAIARELASGLFGRTPAQLTVTAGGHITFRPGTRASRSTLRIPLSGFSSKPGMNENERQQHEQRADRLPGPGGAALGGKQ